MYRNYLIILQVPKDLTNMYLFFYNLPRRRSLMSLAACIPSSFRLRSIKRLLAAAALSSADCAQPIRFYYLFIFVIKISRTSKTCQVTENLLETKLVVYPRLLVKRVGMI
ncbi:hypothetical protein GQX74_011273 [Glossina fuscipes]|nr:hypothetical protein GQX74_011273 [Glossina fuscipes]